MKRIESLWLSLHRGRLQMADEKTRAGLEKWLVRQGYANPYARLEDIAEEIGVSQLQLSYYFRVIIGTPFLTWRKRQRILEAKTLLLKYPEKSIASIGEAVGIPDKSNFRKQFVSVVKMTPAEYRKAQLHRFKNSQKPMTDESETDS